jgi:transposase
MPCSDSDTTKEPGGSNVIAISRMAHDPRTRTYVDCRTTEGLSKKEIIRCLKRYIARELYKILTQRKTQTVQTKDLAKAA